METTNIGRIYDNDCISVLLDYADDDNAELMEQIRVEVSHENGCPYILAEDVMELLSLIAQKAQKHPIRNTYVSDEYNY